MIPKNAELIMDLNILRNDLTMNIIDDKVRLIKEAEANILEWVKEQVEIIADHYFHDSSDCISKTELLNILEGVK